MRGNAARSSSSGRNGGTRGAKPRYAPASVDLYAPTAPTLLDTAMPDLTGARTLTVKSAGGSYTPAQLQTAITDAFNDRNTNGRHNIIEIDAGLTIAGAFTLPATANAAQKWVVIRSGSMASLPAEGTRVQSADGANMPTLRVNTINAPVLASDGATDRVRLVGLHFDVDSAYSTNEGNIEMVQFGNGGATTEAELPSWIVIDRCFAEGGTTANIIATMRRFASLHSRSGAVIDSYIRTILSTGGDAQAVWCGMGPGPYRIVNNYLEATGENFMSGGTDPPITNMIPSDIEFRRNHCPKLLSWWDGDPSYAGTTYAVKNCFELKNAKRVWVEGNVFGPMWAGGQTYMIALTVRNQDTASPWSTIQDVLFENNRLDGCVGAIQVLGDDNNYPSVPMERLTIRNNLLTDVNASWGDAPNHLFHLSRAINYGRIEHNTADNQDADTLDNVYLWIEGGIHFRFRDNVVFNGRPDLDPINGGGVQGIYGSSTSGGTNTLDTYVTDYSVTNNMVIEGGTQVIPAGNLFPANAAAAKFVDYAGGDFRLAADSPGHLAATDGTDLGCDIDALEAAIQGVV